MIDTVTKLRNQDAAVYVGVRVGADGMSHLD
jgi:hypothetical protein